MARERLPGRFAIALTVFHSISLVACLAAFVAACYATAHTQLSKAYMVGTLVASLWTIGEDLAELAAQADRDLAQLVDGKAGLAQGLYGLLLASPNCTSAWLICSAPVAWACMPSLTIKPARCKVAKWADTVDWDKPQRWSICPAQMPYSWWGELL